MKNYVRLALAALTLLNSFSLGLAQPLRPSENSTTGSIESSWNIGLLLTLLFGLISVISTAFTVYYGKKAAYLERTRTKLEWTDIQSAASELGAQLKKRFKTDMVVAFSPRGAMIAYFLLQDIGENIPILVGNCQWKDSPLYDGELCQYDCIETNKWKVYIPKSIYDNKSQKVLIVDDYAMSGESLEKMKKLLISNGFDPANIRTLTIVCTDVAIQNHRSPDFYWLKTSTTSFYFPWGKAR